MAKLIQPRENVIQTTGGNISGGTAAASQAVRVGESIERLGKQYFDEARQADQTIAYSNAMTAATEEYTKLADERMQKTLDDKGNPSYSSLVQDVGAIGADVSKRIGGRLFDPEVRRRFNIEFGRFDSNQRLKAFSTARKQQISFGRESIIKNLRSREQAAIQANPDQLGFYEDQTRKELETALASGLISPIERDQMQEGFRKTVRVESYRNLIQSDPYGMNKELANSDPRALGLTEQEKDRLLRESEAAVHDADMARARQISATQKANDDQINQRMSSFEVAYAEYEAGLSSAAPALSDIVAAREEIGDDNYIKLLKRHLSAEKKVSGYSSASNDLSTALSTGEPTRDFSNKVVDAHYRDTLRTLQSEKEDGQPLTLQEMAGVASTYRRPVREFSDTVNASILEGNPQRAEDALMAYLDTRAHKSKALDDSSFTSEAEAVAEYAETLIDQGGLSAPDAIAIARERVLEGDTERVRVREREFKDIRALTPDRIVETMNSEMDLESFVLGRNVDIPESAQEAFRSFAKEAYVRTGDKSSALKIAGNRMNATYGVSEVNGKKKFMFAAPEKEFPGLTSDQLTEQLITDVTPLIADTGIKAENISLTADYYTKGTYIEDEDGKKHEVVVYNVTYEKELPDGTVVDLPLLNPVSNEPVIWFPDVSKGVTYEDIQDELAQEQKQIVESAREELEEKKSRKQEEVSRDAGVQERAKTRREKLRERERETKKTVDAIKSKVFGAIERFIFEE